jgi:hypothetical protein
MENGVQLQLFRCSRVVVLLVLVVAVAGGLQKSVSAQAPLPRSLRVLAGGVDINGQGFPLVVIDLVTGTATTLVTFGNRPACLPAVLPPGEVVLYESLGASRQSTLYQVNAGTGERTSLAVNHDLGVTCPVIAPDGSAIAWLRIPEATPQDRDTAALTTLVLTDGDGANATELVSHPHIFDVRWSPGGGALVYSVTSGAVPYPVLFSMPREGKTEPRPVWQQQNGLLQDYSWLPNSAGLLVAYRTESAVGVAFLPTDCVIGPGDPCPIQALATFPSQAMIRLLNAFAPDYRQAAISLNSADPASGQPQTDLWLLDLSGQTPPRQLTFSPDNIETEAHWSLDGNWLYFIGSEMEAETEILHGQIYRLDLTDETAAPAVAFASSVFSPSAFLWWYE